MTEAARQGTVSVFVPRFGKRIVGTLLRRPPSRTVSAKCSSSDSRWLSSQWRSFARSMPFPSAISIFRTSYLPSLYEKYLHLYISKKNDLCQAKKLAIALATARSKRELFYGGISLALSSWSFRISGQGRCLSQDAHSGKSHLSSHPSSSPAAMKRVMSQDNRRKGKKPSMAQRAIDSISLTSERIF